MSSVGEVPTSAATDKPVDVSITSTMKPDMFGEASSSPGLEGSGKPVPKRPFLKRGARMPISKIPVDPNTPVVEAIKNPPKSFRAHEPGAGANDLDRSYDKSYDPPPKLKQVALSPLPVSKKQPPVVSSKQHLAIKSPTTMSKSVPKLQLGGSGGGAAGITGGRYEEELDALMRDTSIPPMSSLGRRSAFTGQPTSVVEEKSRMSKTLTVPASSGGPTSVSTRSTADSMLAGHSKTNNTQAPPDQAVLDRIKELDTQIERFKKENEHVKKLRLEREAALAEANRYKERALKELELAEKEIEDQKSQLTVDKKKFQQDKDRGRSIASQMRELMDENRLLKERVSELEADGDNKGKKFKNEISRLNSLLSDMARQKYDLELEIKTLNAQLVIKQGVAKKLPATIDFHRKLTSSPPIFFGKQSQGSSKSVGEVIREDPSSGDLVSEVTHADGKVDRTHPDGKREAVYPSGLRKISWPNGAAVVHFPNGDVKETGTDGIVVYNYYSTGCKQTTFPDGREVIEFSSGQVENHYPDGSREIVFPSKLVRKYAPSGELIS